MNFQKILVIGAGGFIGKNLVLELIKFKFIVFAMGRNDSPQLFTDLYTNNKNFNWIKGDYQNIDLLEDLLKKVDTVIHLACTTIPKLSNEDPVFDIQSNVLPSINLINLAVKNNIKKFIYLSSGGTIYGQNDCTPIYENHDTNPICSYGIHKLTVEKYLNLNHTLHGMNYVVVRLSNPYGELQDVNRGQGLITTLVNKIQLNQVVEIWGDGSNERDYIHVNDVSAAIIMLINYTGKMKIFNVGSGIGTSINNLIAVLKTMPKIKFRYKYLPKRNLDLPYNVLNIELIKNEINWSPRYNIYDFLHLQLHKDFFKIPLYI